LQAALAEKNALQHTTEDATAALTEKLALTRELSVLKPELEHLKAQAASTEALMTEKLALQRQFTELQAEAENAKREAKRALAKRRNTGVELAQEEQMEELRRQCATEKRGRQRAEERAQAIDADDDREKLQQQLSKKSKQCQKLEDQLAALGDTSELDNAREEVVKLRKELAEERESNGNLQVELEQEKKAAHRAKKRADGIAQADEEAEELRNELAKGEKKRVKAEKSLQEAAEQYAAELAALEEKCERYRKKGLEFKNNHKEMKAKLQESMEAHTDVDLRLEETTGKLQESEAKRAEFERMFEETNTKLLDTQAQLKKAHEGVAAANKKAAAAPKATAPKPRTKKRAAAEMDPDASTLGTPGDRPVAKRGRKAAPNVGDKSTFSITPFLNKTTSVIQDDDEEADSDADEISPAVTKKKQPLAQQPASKANVPAKKAAAQRKPKAPMLEMVTEENEPADDVPKGKENAKPTKSQTLKVKTKTADGPENTGDPTKKKPKQRKSLADFASFDPQPDVEKRQKKRKLGGLGKTLFDEEETEPMKRPLFGTKGFALLGGGKKSGSSSSFLGGSKAGTTLLTAGDGSGFQFSPLKKSRRNLDDTLRM
jgi:hypothetical protein